jgi:putative ABC transport system permease protein
MPYSLATLWHDRQRFLPGVLAVAFSALLIALQCGLLLGIFSITSIPIDHTRADIWMGAPEVLSVDLGQTIRGSFEARLASQPEVVQVEPYMQGFSYWAKPKGGRELCMLIGSRLGADALGAVDILTPDMRARLGEPGAIIVDESDLDRLGILQGVGATTEISNQRVRVVGLTRGLKSLAGPYVFCSLETARSLLGAKLTGTTDQVTYVLARCRDPEDAPRVVARMRQQYDDVSTFTSGEFSFRSRMHWLLKTKAGIALGYAALLGLLVGAVVTNQTLYAATVASLREYAVLRALGIPRWRIAGMVLAQSFWVGVFGVTLGWVASHAARYAATSLGASVSLPPELQAGAAAITLVTALLSGLFALRSLRLVEPAMLLR